MCLHQSPVKVTVTASLCFVWAFCLFVFPLQTFRLCIRIFNFVFMFFLCVCVNVCASALACISCDFSLYICLFVCYFSNPNLLLFLSYFTLLFFQMLVCILMREKGQVEGYGRSWGRENCNQNIVYEKSISNKINI